MFSSLFCVEEYCSMNKQTVITFIPIDLIYFRLLLALDQQTALVKRDNELRVPSVPQKENEREPQAL